TLTTHLGRWWVEWDYGPVVLSAGGLLVLWLFCLWLYRRKFFLRILGGGMAGISDTSPEAEQVLRELLRAMPFERKWRQMSILYHTGKVLHAAALSARFPGITPEHIHAAWVEQCGLDNVPAPKGGLLMLGSEEANLVVEHV